MHSVMKHTEFIIEAKETIKLFCFYSLSVTKSRDID